MKVAQIIDNKAKEFPTKAAIIFKNNVITFIQLRDYVFKLAGGFTDSGIKKGDKVAIYLPNCPEYIFSYLALFSIGVVVVPLDFMLTEGEIINFINHSESSTLIAKEKRDINFKNIKETCAYLKKVVILGESEVNDTLKDGDLSWHSALKNDSSLPKQDISDEDYSSIFYTSGSTGHPKGVLLTYGHLDNPVKCIDHFLHPSDKDSYLCAGVPFSHIGGLDYMLFMLYFGSTLVLMDRFHPLEALKNLEKYKITIFCIVPAMFVAILSLKECDKFDLSSLRYPVVFGAPSSPVLLKRFHKLCPNACLLNGWGMTETAAPNTYSPPDISKIDSIGKFGAGMEAKIIDEQGNTMTQGEKGELWVKGEAIMVGYYKEEDLTRQVITEDGWLQTGDIARCDKGGLFYLVGRKKEMIKVAGEIVFAPEVETVVHRHPKVQEVAVVGIPDKLRGEVPKAFIVCREGETCSEEEIRYFCRDHIAHFKVPHFVEFRGSLPKTTSGKIDKEFLKNKN